MSFFQTKNSAFEKLIEKATSNLLLETDWTINMSVCDSVRQGDVTMKFALTCLKKRLNSTWVNTNPHGAHHALVILETLMKNCGTRFHEEVLVGSGGSNELVDLIGALIRQPPNPKIKEKSLRMLQAWVTAFGRQSEALAGAGGGAVSAKLRESPIHALHDAIRATGERFPQLEESDMIPASAGGGGVDTLTGFPGDFQQQNNVNSFGGGREAPEWKDADQCFSCRAQFSTIRRKHHCRHCGNVFCVECTQKRTTIPKFGLEKEVRVCDSCYSLIKNGGAATTASGAATSTGGGGPHVKFNEEVQVKNVAALSAQQHQHDEEERKKKKKELEMQEKEELELALALSASEAENAPSKKQPQPHTQPQSLSATLRQPIRAQEAAEKPASQSGGTSALSDPPELAKYLDRDFWNARQQPTQAGGGGGGGISSMTQSVGQLHNEGMEPSAPQASTPSSSINSSCNASLLNGSATHTHAAPPQLDTKWLENKLVEFCSRMHADQSRGRSIASDPTVQALMTQLSAAQPQLLYALSRLEMNRNHLESVQDRIGQVREAREALDQLRAENRERRQKEAEEAERVRQQQMMQKVQALRHQKQEMLNRQAMDRMRMMSSGAQPLPHAMYQQAAPLYYQQAHTQYYNYVGGGAPPPPHYATGAPPSQQDGQSQPPPPHAQFYAQQMAAPVYSPMMQQHFAGPNQSPEIAQQPQHQQFDPNYMMMQQAAQHHHQQPHQQAAQPPPPPPNSVAQQQPPPLQHTQHTMGLANVGIAAESAVAESAATSSPPHDHPQQQQQQQQQIIAAPPAVAQPPPPQPQPQPPQQEEQLINFD